MAGKMDLSHIREKLIFKKKKDLKPRSDGKPHYRLDDVVSGLPSSRHYGVFTAWFISNFCPEKNQVKNMRYLFDVNDSVIETIQNLYTKETKWVSVSKGSTKKIEVPSVVTYTPDNVIDLFSGNSFVVKLMYEELSKLLHKKLSYKTDLVQQERALALILARTEKLCFDVMAAPFGEHFFDEEFGFKEAAYFDVINVLVSENYFYRTHGTGILKRKGVITLPDGIDSPRTYDEANYIPSLLVPDYKILSLYKRCFQKSQKKNNKGLQVRMFGETVKIPVPFVESALQLSPEVYKKMLQVKFDNCDTSCVLRRTKEEFFKNLNNLGLRSRSDRNSKYETMADIRKVMIGRFYDFVARLAYQLNFNYARIVHTVTRHFKELDCDLYYTSGAFKNAVQFILFGQTENNLINQRLIR